VELGDHPGVVLTQPPAAVDQDPQHGKLLVVDHRPQPAHPGADQGDAMSVGGVGLATLTGGEHSGPRRQLRRLVDDLLAVGEEPGGDVFADAGTSLDRPGARDADPSGGSWSRALRRRRSGGMLHAAPPLRSFSICSRGCTMPSEQQCSMTMEV
jgi:hypothetical protein